MDGTILVADDDRTIRTVLSQALTRAGCKVHATASLTTLMRWVDEGKGDLVVTDVMMPDGNGLQMLPMISKSRPDMPVIVISAQNTITTAIEAEEAQAFDYLPKPFDLPDLMKRVGQGLRTRAPAGDDTPRAGSNPAEPLPIVGTSAPMQALYKQIARIVNTTLPVMVIGESGTGKSLIARILHDQSDRRMRPFVTVNGDEIGDHDAETLLSRARGGTVQIDEIADIPRSAQGRLVRLLDTAPDDAPRFVASSGRDLASLMEDGELREDLYYRLSGVTIDIPALRQRIEDIPLLVETFCKRAEIETIKPRRVSDAAMDRLKAYPWPGNVRQLENTVRNLAITGVEDDISAKEVDRVLSLFPAPQVGSFRAGDKLGASVQAHLQRYFDLHGGALPPPGLYNRVLREIELPLIEIALDATGGNQAKCADLLGINRNTLRKKITELDIVVTRRRKMM